MWSIIKLKVGDLAASTIDPKIKFSVLIGKKTDITDEYLSSASDISLVFIFAIIGNIIFGDIDEFSNLASAMFTLFKATLQTYDIELM